MSNNQTLYGIINMLKNNCRDEQNYITDLFNEFSYNEQIDINCYVNTSYDLIAKCIEHYLLLIKKNEKLNCLISKFKDKPCECTYKNIIIFLRSFEKKHLYCKIIKELYDILYTNSKSIKSSCEYKKLKLFLNNGTIEYIQKHIHKKIIYSYIDGEGIVMYNSSLYDNFSNDEDNEIENTNSYYNYLLKLIPFSSNSLQTIVNKKIKNYENANLSEILFLKETNMSYLTSVDFIDGTNTFIIGLTMCLLLNKKYCCENNKKIKVYIDIACYKIKISFVLLIFGLTEIIKLM